MTALDQAFIKAYSREREPRRGATTTTAAGHEPWAAAEVAAAPRYDAPRAAPIAREGAPAALRFDFGAGNVPAPMGPIWPWNATPASAPAQAPMALGGVYLPGYAPPTSRAAPAAAPTINPDLPAWGPWNDHGPWSPAVPPISHSPAPLAWMPATDLPADVAIDITTSDVLMSYCGAAEADLDDPSLALGPIVVQSTRDEELLAPNSPTTRAGLDPCCVPRDWAEAAAAPLSSLAVAPLAWEPTRADRASAVRPEKTPRFQPQWEVEQFTWPAACDRVIAAQDAAFAGLLERFALAAVGGDKIVAVAGCSAGDGKSTLALCLAREAARAGLSVALVDADFDHPQLAELLSVAAPRGWEEALAGDLPLVETSVASAVDGVHLFPLHAGRSEPDAGRQAALIEALELLAERHDLVLVDMGTISVDDEPVGHAPQKNLLAALLVRDCRTVDEQQALRVAQQLRAAGVDVLGRVDNFR